MAKGTLRVRGGIDVGQFWPGKLSDADTVKVAITAPFEFQPGPGAPFTPTQAFDNAVVTGQFGRHEAVKKGQITVRLQGVDAPELHYQPRAAIGPKTRAAEQHTLYLKWNLNYRQKYAETATVALATQLGGGGVVNCEVRTRVDEPNEVFDIYGRFVGEIYVGALSINEWLLRQGWAIPAFYASMIPDEIERLTLAARQGYPSNAGRAYRGHIDAALFDWSSEFRRGGPVNPAADAGLFLMPKLFRRYSTWAVNRRAKMITSSFMTYLRSKRDDQVHLADEFVVQGTAAARAYHLADLFGGNGGLAYRPEKIVFREKESTLRRPDGSIPGW